MSAIEIDSGDAKNGTGHLRCEQCPYLIHRWKLLLDLTKHRFEILIEEKRWFRFGFRAGLEDMLVLFLIQERWITFLMLNIRVNMPSPRSLRMVNFSANFCW